jgi:hypothetical protein
MVAFVKAELSKLWFLHVLTCGFPVAGTTLGVTYLRGRRELAPHFLITV